jgi:hypothetical protein
VRRFETRLTPTIATTRFVCDASFCVCACCHFTVVGLRQSSLQSVRRGALPQRCRRPWCGGGLVVSHTYPSQLKGSSTISTHRPACAWTPVKCRHRGGGRDLQHSHSCSARCSISSLTSRVLVEQQKSNATTPLRRFAVASSSAPLSLAWSVPLRCNPRLLRYVAVARPNWR